MVVVVVVVVVELVVMMMMMMGLLVLVWGVGAGAFRAFMWAIWGCQDCVWRRSGFAIVARFTRSDGDGGIQRGWEDCLLLLRGRRANVLV